MPTVENAHWGVILPQVILGVAMLLILLQEMIGAGRRAEFAGVTAIGASGLALLAVLLSPSVAAPAFSGMVVHDGLFRAFAAAILTALLLALILSGQFMERQRASHRAEFYALLVVAGLGMLLMAAAVDLSMVFLGLELFSLALYLLCLVPLGRAAAQEAAMKYFLLSSFASAIFLYGLALLYGATGSLSLADLAAASPAGPGRPLVLAGMVLVGVGLAFKLAAAPFHLWAPDVYQGAPTPVTAFMSVSTKTAALAVLVRLFPLALNDFARDWQAVLAVLAVLTILVGNLGALATSNVKRMLAWSSVAHGGYLLIAPLVTGTDPARSEMALQALLYYLLVYAFMNLGAFAAVGWVEGSEGTGCEVKALAGLASRRPAAAAAIALVMLSLTGIPPLGGFFAKLYLFGTAVAAGWSVLAVLGVVGSLIGAAYYLRVVVAMYMREPAGDLPPMDSSTAVVLGLSVAGVVLTGLLAQPILAWVQEAARAALGG